MRKARVVVVNLLVIIAVLVVTEGLCRAILQQVYNREFDSNLIQPNKYGSSDGLKPLAEGIVWGKLCTTDKYGGRKNATVAKGKKKWLFIGDSVTQGVGVADSATFVYRVSQADTNYRVVNLSLTGYTTADYLNVLTEVLYADTTIKRITLGYCLNDVYGSTPGNSLPVMARQNISGRLNGLLQNRYATYKLIKLLVYQNTNSYYRYDAAFYKANSPQFVEAMEHLRLADSLATAHGVRLNVVLLPYRSQLEATEQSTMAPQQLVMDYCAGHSITCYNAAEAWQQAGLTPKEAYLFADEIHLSEQGHRWLAKAIIAGQGNW